MSFIPQACFRKQKVIILLHRSAATLYQEFTKFRATRCGANSGQKVWPKSGESIITCVARLKSRKAASRLAIAVVYPILASDKGEISGVINFIFCLPVCLHPPFTDICSFNLSSEETEPSEEPLQTTRSCKPQTESPKTGLEPRTVFLRTIHGY